MLNLSFHPDLYLGESIPKRKIHVIRKLLCKYPHKSNYFLITLSHNPGGQFDVFSSTFLEQKCVDGQIPYIISICKNREEAFKVLEEIAGASARTSFGGDLKGYVFRESNEKTS